MAIDRASACSFFSSLQLTHILALAAKHRVLALVDQRVASALSIHEGAASCGASRVSRPSSGVPWRLWLMQAQQDWVSDLTSRKSHFRN